MQTTAGSTGQAHDNLRGSLFMLAAMASFAVGDSILKHVAEVLPLSQILVIRGSFAIIGLVIAANLLGKLRPVSSIATWPFALRIIGELVATAFFLTALFNMPMANASAIMQSLPLTVSLGAAYFFGEKIGWRRILAISVGLFGVLLIVQPGLSGFNIYSVSCLIAVVGTTLRDLATRKLPPDMPTLFVTLVTVIFVVAFGLGLSLFQEWQTVGMGEIGLLFIASFFLVSGFLTIVSAMRVGEVAIVTPYRYSVLLFAVILGFVFFDEVPDSLTITGSIIVVASGIYTFYREQIVGRRSLRETK